MRIFSVLWAASLFFLLVACSHGSLRGPASLPPGGSIHEITGISPRFGAYSGAIQVLPTENGLLVTRVVTYRDFRYEGLEVQEVWQATGSLSDGVLRVSFPLKQADSLLSVDGLRRDPSQFGFNTALEYLADFGASVGSFGGGADKIGNGESVGLEEEALWKDERAGLLAQDSRHPSSAMNFEQAVRAYRESPLVRPYAARPEFQSRRQYFVFDPTDFEFLRNHPGTLRVANKVLDLISLAEASLKRDAYGPTLAEKAEAFDRDFAVNHLNELGLYSAAAFDDSGTRVAYVSRSEDGLLTGAYAGSQAMRWLVTHDAEAMENFRRSLRGLLLLLDVAGSDAEFARSASPFTEGETLAGGWKRGNGPFAGVKYLDGGNADAAKSIFYAFAWANEILPEGDSLRGEVAAHSARFPRLRVARDFSRFGNRFLASGLAAVAGNDPEQYREFLSLFSFSRKAAKEAGQVQAFHHGGMVDWRGVNLNAISQTAQILVAKQAAQKFGGNEARLRGDTVLRQLRQNLLDTWGTFAGSRRGFLTIAAHAFALENSQGLTTASSPVVFPQVESWNTDREQAIWRLREIPAVRRHHDLVFDFTLRPDWSLSAWPRRPWTAAKEPAGAQALLQGAYDYPAFESVTGPTGDYWQDTFQFRGEATAAERSGRVDYLNGYWMGRLSGLLGEGT